VVAGKNPDWGEVPPQTPPLGDGVPPPDPLHKVFLRVNRRFLGLLQGFGNVGEVGEQEYINIAMKIPLP